MSRIQDGLGELKTLLETHIHNQGLSAIEKCGEGALNVSVMLFLEILSDLIKGKPNSDCKTEN